MSYYGKPMDVHQRQDNVSKSEDDATENDALPIGEEHKPATSGFVFGGAFRSDNEVENANPYLIKEVQQEQQEHDAIESATISEISSFSSRIVDAPVAVLPTRDKKHVKFCNDCNSINIFEEEQTGGLMSKWTREIIKRKAKARQKLLTSSKSDTSLTRSLRLAARSIDSIYNYIQGEDTAVNKTASEPSLVTAPDPTSHLDDLDKRYLPRHRGFYSYTPPPIDPIIQTSSSIVVDNDEQDGKTIPRIVIDGLCSTVSSMFSLSDKHVSDTDSQMTDSHRLPGILKTRIPSQVDRENRESTGKQPPESGYYVTSERQREDVVTAKVSHKEQTEPVEVHSPMNAGHVSSRVNNSYEPAFTMYGYLNDDEIEAELSENTKSVSTSKSQIPDMLATTPNYNHVDYTKESSDNLQNNVKPNTTSYRFNPTNSGFSVVQPHHEDPLAHHADPLAHHADPLAQYAVPGVGAQKATVYDHYGEENSEQNMYNYGYPKHKESFNSSAPKMPTTIYDEKIYLKDTEPVSPGVSRSTPTQPGSRRQLMEETTGQRFYGYGYDAYHHLPMCMGEENTENDIEEYSRTKLDVITNEVATTDNDSGFNFQTEYKEATIHPVDDSGTKTAHYSMAGGESPSEVSDYVSETPGFEPIENKEVTGRQNTYNTGPNTHFQLVESTNDSMQGYLQADVKEVEESKNKVSSSMYSQQPPDMLATISNSDPYDFQKENPEYKQYPITTNKACIYASAYQLHDPPGSAETQREQSMYDSSHYGYHQNKEYNNWDLGNTSSAIHDDSTQRRVTDSTQRDRVTETDAHMTFIEETKRQHFYENEYKESELSETNKTHNLLTDNYLSSDVSGYGHKTSGFKQIEHTDPTGIHRSYNVGHDSYLQHPRYLKTTNDSMHGYRHNKDTYFSRHGADTHRKHSVSDSYYPPVELKTLSVMHDHRLHRHSPEPTSNHGTSYSGTYANPTAQDENDESDGSEPASENAESASENPEEQPDVLSTVNEENDAQSNQRGTSVVSSSNYPDEASTQNVWGSSVSSSNYAYQQPDVTVTDNDYQQPEVIVTRSESRKTDFQSDLIILEEEDEDISRNPSRKPSTHGSQYNQNGQFGKVADDSAHTKTDDSTEQEICRQCTAIEEIFWACMFVAISAYVLAGPD